MSRIAVAAAANTAARRCSVILYGVHRNRSRIAWSKRRLTSKVMTAPRSRVHDMSLAGRQFIEAIVRLQFFEDEFNLPACRVGLSNALSIQRIGVDVGQVEPILGALGESDRYQAHTTANRAPNARVDASLKRHFDFDIEDLSVQSAGHLLEPFVFHVDGAPAPQTVHGHDTRVGIGVQAGGGLSPARRSP